jgi:hypothetical protein
MKTVFQNQLYDTFKQALTEFSIQIYLKQILPKLNNQDQLSSREQKFVSLYLQNNYTEKHLQQLYNQGHKIWDKQVLGDRSYVVKLSKLKRNP